ncbi:hypothetical protein CIHG_09791 [Coccidioides immitis H538.4]|uniref:Extracellular mutant protein 11 C-terminal domain-containing protein n=1 Tax=Coccidioides immitis H538.4 TaxID=396776 RepID=A0A0J8S6N7_COCIT|nr:hypothetical protein CIHG_09791 [Coccidioides immitis H538.4]
MLKVSDYVHGTIPQNNDRPVSQGTSKGSIPSSRLRAAELARVNVPPTRLAGFNATPAVNMHGRQQSQNLQMTGDQRIGPFGALNPEHRDMFDTDVEGFDDSTTTMSLVRDDDVVVPPPPQEERLASPRRGRDNGTTHHHGDMSLDPIEWRILHSGNYMSIAERMKELDSEPDDLRTSHQHEHYHQNFEAHVDEQDGDHDMELEGEPTIKVGWDANHGNSQHAMSWQQIEAALREHNRQTAGNESSSVHVQNTCRHTRFKVNYRALPEMNQTRLPLSPSQTDTNNDQYHNNQGGIFDTTDLSALDSSEESITEPNMPPSATSPQLSTLSPVSSKRPFTAFTSDYHPNILHTKSYSDLQAEPFDYNPAPPPPVFPPQDPELPLIEKLHRLKSLTDDQRRNFFSSLTQAEWEDSGDWLIEQFGVILQKTKNARRERRQVAAVFEAEIKRRYELVEGEVKDIRDRMDDMRAGGMGVLKGRG